MTGYDFAINHIKGTTNERVDALSRRPDYKAQERIKKQFLQVKEDKLEMVEATENDVDIIRLCHDSRTSGHQGIAKTLQRVKEIRIWPRMRRDFEQ